jgi:hypothetical protein
MNFFFKVDCPPTPSPPPHLGHFIARLWISCWWSAVGFFPSNYLVALASTHQLGCMVFSVDRWVSWQLVFFRLFRLYMHASIEHWIEFDLEV